MSAQIRVYGLPEACAVLGARPGPIAAHRLAAKLSSLAWSPALPGVITVGDYDGSVLQVRRVPSYRCVWFVAVVCACFRVALALPAAVSRNALSRQVCCAVRQAQARKLHAACMMLHCCTRTSALFHCSMAMCIGEHRDRPLAYGY